MGSKLKYRGANHLNEAYFFFRSLLFKGDRERYFEERVWENFVIVLYFFKYETAFNIYFERKESVERVVEILEIN